MNWLEDSYFTLRFRTDDRTVAIEGEDFSPLNDSFPSLSAVDSFEVGSSYYSLLVGQAKTPLPVKILVTAETSSELEMLGQIVRTEDAWLDRRQFLLSVIAGSSWHYIANISTAGMGYLAYMKLQRNDAVPESVLLGIEKSLRRLQEGSRIITSLVRRYESIREINLIEVCRIVGEFAQGCFMPDFNVEMQPSVGVSGVLLKEIPAMHILLELFIALHSAGCRRILLNVVENTKVLIEVDRQVALSSTVALLIAQSLGTAYGLQVEQVSDSRLALSSTVQ